MLDKRQYLYHIVHKGKNKMFIKYNNEWIRVNKDDLKIKELNIVIRPGVIISGEIYIEKGAGIREGTIIKEGVTIRAASYIGVGAIIKTGAIIGEKVYIGDEAIIKTGAIIREMSYIGEKTSIGVGTIIGEKSVIGAGAYIGDRVVIKKETDIDVIVSKYYCNRYNNIIRIGCETHAIDKWENEDFQNELAIKHNELEWWNSRGKKILEFLINY
jgi:UDP-3-O-[3-hydroxymyristoyl] glucosamine N-acyltransferase